LFMVVSSTAKLVLVHLIAQELQSSTNE